MATKRQKLTKTVLLDKYVLDGELDTALEHLNKDRIVGEAFGSQYDIATLEDVQVSLILDVESYSDCCGYSSFSSGYVNFSAHVTAYRTPSPEEIRADEERKAKQRERNRIAAEKRKAKKLEKQEKEREELLAKVKQDPVLLEQLQKEIGK